MVTTQSYSLQIFSDILVKFLLLTSIQHDSFHYLLLFF